jgi:adenylate cyclase
VLALDVLLRDISQFTMSLAPSDHGFVYVLSSQDTVLGLPKGTGLSADLAVNHLPSLQDVFSVPAAAAGHQFWVAQGKQANVPIRFIHDNQVWWAGFRPFPFGTQQRVWIGVMVPQNDFMGDLDRQRNHTLLILAGSLAAAVAMVLLLARGYSTPLRALVLQSQRIESLDLHPPVPVPSRLREVAQLGQAQEKMRGALQSFARYVPTDVVRELIERGEAARIGGRIETLSVLFSDIRGFTSLAESMNPEALMHELADYFNAIQEVLDLHRATLDKFIGDAVLAFWGAPTPNPDHAETDPALC